MVKGDVLGIAGRISCMLLLFETLRYCTGTERIAVPADRTTGIMAIGIIGIGISG